MSVDVGHLQAKRDRMVGELRGMGYELHVPEATFYLLPRSPVPEDRAFVVAADEVLEVAAPIDLSPTAYPTELHEVGQADPR